MTTINYSPYDMIYICNTWCIYIHMMWWWIMQYLSDCAVINSQSQTNTFTNNSSNVFHLGSAGFHHLEHNWHAVTNFLTPLGWDHRVPPCYPTCFPPWEAFVQLPGLLALTARLHWEWLFFWQGQGQPWIAVSVWSKLSCWPGLSQAGGIKGKSGGRYGITVN